MYEKSIIPVIEAKYYSFTATEKRIADYFIKHDSVENLTIQEIADEIFVSQASISRFAKKCGYNGFRDFFYEYLDSVRSSEKKLSADSAKKVFNTYQDILNRAYSLVDNALISRVVDKLNNAKRVIACGIGSSGYVASEMESRFLRVGLDVDSLTHYDRIRMQGVFIKEGTLVVGFSISGESESVLYLLEQAHRRGAKTILFTSVDKPSFKRFCDEVVLVASIKHLDQGNGISPQFPMLLVLDLIYSEYMNYDNVLKNAIHEDTLSALKAGKQREENPFFA